MSLAEWISKKEYEKQIDSAHSFTDHTKNEVDVDFCLEFLIRIARSTLNAVADEILPLHRAPIANL